MNNLFRKTIAVIAVAGAAAFTPSSFAFDYADGDLLLGFRATSGTGSPTDILVDLGAASQFVTAGIYATGNIVTVTIPGSILADLNATYTSGWTTRSDVLWSISGTQKVAGNGFVANTYFASNQEPSPGTQSAAWPRQGTSGNAGTAGKIQAEGQFTALPANVGTGDPANGGQANSSNSSAAVLQATNFGNNHVSYQPGGSNSSPTTAYSYFQNGIEGNFGGGTGNSVLDLYRLDGTTANGVPGILLGGFEFSNNGILSFSSDISDFATAVPEPSTYAMAALGGLFLLLLTIRRTRRIGA